jgi:hypothetical protein
MLGPVQTISDLFSSYLPTDGCSLNGLAEEVLC